MPPRAKRPVKRGKDAVAPKAVLAAKIQEVAAEPSDDDVVVQERMGKLIGVAERQFGEGALMALQGGKGLAIEVVPTGLPSLDAALGVGGLPKGRIIEILGPESAGKTSLALMMLGKIQAQGLVAAFVDAEHALDSKWAARLGVRLDRLLISQPDNGEQALEMVELLVRSGEVGIVVVDSVAALVPRAEIEGEMGDSHVGLQARLMSQAMRKLDGVTSRMGTVLIFINQIRHKIGVMFGSPETTTGGNALKFYASVRLDVRKGGWIKEGEKVVGAVVKVKVVKNKVAPPFREAELDLRYADGFDCAADILQLATERKVVEMAGAWFSFGGEKLGQGKAAAVAALRASPELQVRVLAAMEQQQEQEEEP